MHPCPTLTVLAAGQVAELPRSLSGSASVLGFTSLPRVFANASGRIEFIIFLIMDWLFASGCFPPRLSTTQLPSATDSQCSVRRGLPPRCWCALSGALRSHLRGDSAEQSRAAQRELRPTDGVSLAYHWASLLAGRIPAKARFFGKMRRDWFLPKLQSCRYL